MVTTTVEGLERFGVNVRYPRDLRDSPQMIARQVLVPTRHGARRNDAAGAVGKGEVVKGAPAIRTENSLLSAYIYVDIRDRDIGGYVRDAQKAVQEQVKFPPGYYVTWSGQFEYMERAIAKMKIVDSADLADYFPAALSQLQAHHRNPDRDAVGAVCPGRRGVADVAAGLQHERGGGGGLYRAGRCGG